MILHSNANFISIINININIISITIIIIITIIIKNHIFNVKWGYIMAIYPSTTKKNKNVINYTELSI